MNAMLVSGEEALTMQCVSLRSVVTSSVTSLLKFSFIALVIRRSEEPLHYLTGIQRYSTS